MNVKNITRVSLKEAMKTEGQTDWEYVKNDDHDTGLDGFDWENAVFDAPPFKKLVSIRLDVDVLEFFKSNGRGYQTRINQVLKSYVQAKQRSS
ncbi:MAG: BrnA antitoxin family protein [Alphaproteobacteria bacterium]|nr:BrnA antitoxin family protein [Alphaproteobacteria bacterium]